MIILVFYDFGEGGLREEGVIFDGADASFGLLVDDSEVVDVLLVEWAFILEHDCYYMN